MKRRVIRIDEEKCNGCGACARACHEGAIGMVNGKAKLMRDDFCDGLGDCLPACPTGAISFEEREAAAYDAQAVLAARSAHAGGCPGARAAALRPAMGAPCVGPEDGGMLSALRQWPVQIKLAPVSAPWLAGAQLLIAADCTAYARADFHARFMRDKVTLIGCPKLDGVDYAEKLGEMLRLNAVAGVTVVRMQVPCCGGIVRAVERALELSGRSIPLSVVTLATDGRIVSEETRA